MQSEVYRLLSVAAACNLSSDVAYEMLQQDFISKFATSYEELEDGPDKPSVLDAFIRYALEEVPLRTGVSYNVVYELRSRRSEIVDTFLNCDLSTMFTQLASRATILEHVRSYLRKENEMPGMYAKVNSSRINVVFTRFLEVFKKNCAHAFQYRGDFVVFVMNCFIKFFYRGNKRDIWAFIREVDLERREVEQSVIVERELGVVRTDDMLIHDLCLNIALANDRLFRHPGHTKDSHGIQYDIYYLVLCLLCRRKVAQINEELGEELIRFVDPLDRKEVWLGLTMNKGIAAKITNAKELVEFMYDYIKDGKLSISSIADLRDICFGLGKHDREGRNCIWEDALAGSETSRYLDVDKSLANFERFDLLLKGVISVYTLMQGVESRGLYLVDSYRRDMFINMDVVRYLDYLSSVEYIPLMLQLQREPSEEKFSNNGLLEFQEMVYEYAGSEGNTRAHILEYRYYAITHGFMVKPKLKQSEVPTSKQEILFQVASALDAIPRSYKDYIDALDKYQQADYSMSTWININFANVVGGRYSMLYYNSYVNDEPAKAKYYLRGRGELSTEQSLDNLGWRVGTSHYEGVFFSMVYSVFVSLEHTFLFYDVDSPSNIFCASMEEVVREYQSKFADGKPTIPMSMTNSPLKRCGIIDKYAELLNRSIGFPWEIGIANLNSLDAETKLSSFPLSREYRKSVQLFYSWCNENSKIQHSFIELLKAMFTECMFLLCGSSRVIRDERIHEIALAKDLYSGLLTGEFTEASLTWILEKFRDCHRLETPDWEHRAFKYRKLDISLLDYLFSDEESLKTLEYKDLCTTLRYSKTAAERFVTAYNFVYTRLLFLRKVRDAYSLLVTSMPAESSSLVCELNQRFGVDTKLKGFLDEVIDYGIRVDTMDPRRTRDKIAGYKRGCVRVFKPLVSGLVDYVEECQDDISQLVDYNVVAQDVMASRFADLGAAFAILPQYPETYELAELRRVASTDSAGFFLMGGSYFHGRSGGSIYYVHRSGRIVRDVNGKLEPVDYNFNDESALKRYTEILREGLRLRGQ